MGTTDNTSVLVCGLSNIPNEATFGSRLFNLIPSQPSSQDTIKIMCEPSGSQYFLARYPADRQVLCGLLTWLSLRSRPDTALRKISFKVDIETEASNSIIVDIVKSLAISPECLVEHAEYINLSDSREPVSRLFQFIDQVKDEGSALFRCRQYDSARDIYMTAFLLTAEWESHIPSKSSKKKWTNSCLDIISSLLQTNIQRKMYDDMDWMIQAAVRLVYRPSYTTAEKRADVLLRCAMTIRAKNKNEAGAMLFALRARDIYPSEKVSMFLCQLRQDVTPLALLGRQVLLNLDAVERRRKERIRQFSKIKIVTADLSCSICTEDYSLEDEVTELPCTHLYHPVCITAWLIEHDTCPVCRRKLF